MPRRADSALSTRRRRRGRLSPRSRTGSMPRRPIVVGYLGWALSLFMTAAYGLGTTVGQLVLFGFIGGLGLSFGQGIGGTLVHQLMPRLAAVAGVVARTIGARETLVAARLLSGGVTVLFLLASPALRR